MICCSVSLFCSSGCLQIFLMLLVWLHFFYVSTHYHCSSSIVALPRMSSQGVWSSMVVVPWIPLVAIDVEVDVPCIHPPCNLDYNVWDPSNLEMNWGLIHSHGCLQLSALSSWWAPLFHWFDWGPQRWSAAISNCLYSFFLIWGGRIIFFPPSLDAVSSHCHCH